MFVGLRKPCIDSNRHPGYGTPGLKYNYRAWDLLGVMYILTYTSYLLG
jgi:hypothetical protein